MSLGISKTLGLLQQQTDGSSLYQHLCETLSRLTEAEDPYKSFEMLSTYVRDVRLPTTAGADLEVPEADPRAPARAEWASATQGLASIAADAQLGDVADFWAQSRLLRAAGLGFSDEECYSLALSIRNLAHRHSAVSARFWGKVLGIENDYYVTEMELSGMDAHNRTDPMEELRPDYVEPRGTGANQYVYFVCTTITGEWARLPNAVPAQITRSRAINKMFTGVLDAPIWSHPPFPWTERELLRSMIARITHATILAPAEYYELQGEEGDQKVVKKPGFTLGGETPATPDKWVHARAYLRSNGRVKYPNDIESDAIAEDEKTRINAQLEREREDDMTVAGAASAAGPATQPAVLWGVKDEIDDYEGKSKESPWLMVKSGEGEGTFRVIGDSATYNFPDPKGPRNYAVTLIESLSFPGAYAVAQGDNFCNIYLGYGLKKQKAFLPLQEMAPGAIMEEPTDLKELIEEPIEEDIDMEEAGDEEGDE